MGQDGVIDGRPQTWSSFLIVCRSVPPPQRVSAAQAASHPGQIVRRLLGQVHTASWLLCCRGAAWLACLIGKV